MRPQVFSALIAAACVTLAGNAHAGALTTCDANSGETIYIAANNGDVRITMETWKSVLPAKSEVDKRNRLVTVSTFTDKGVIAISWRIDDGKGYIVLRLDGQKPREYYARCRTESY